MESCIDLFLQCQPIPGLSAVYCAFTSMWELSQDAKHANEQLITMSESVAELLWSLQTQATNNPVLEHQLADKPELHDLERLLVEITTWIRKQLRENFLKALYHTPDRAAALDRYHKRLVVSLQRLNMSNITNVANLQQKFEEARIKDQDALRSRLQEMQKDQNKLARMLDDQHASILSMMVSLQKAMQSESATVIEKQFLRTSFNYLATTSGQTPSVESWTISSFDVEIERHIGSGGFGEVHLGTWNHCPVALKMLKQDGLSARDSAIKREIKIWERLRHPHLLQFLGANILDDPPFIVMPYMKNGNAHDFLLDHQDFPRGRILVQAARGLEYLHRQNVIHGDLKAVNILIDDGLNAVLADFGLSKLRADVSSRLRSSSQYSTRSSSNGVGSWYWMAPERLQGSSLTASSDIYSFGMTIYEIMTDSIPLLDTPVIDFVDSIVNHDLRPMRPYSSGIGESAELTDDLWEICCRTWEKNPAKRPSAPTLCADLAPFYSDLDIQLPPKQTYEASPLPLPSPPTTEMERLSMYGDSGPLIDGGMLLDQRPITESPPQQFIRRISLLSDTSFDGTIPMHGNSSPSGFSSISSSSQGQNQPSPASPLLVPPTQSPGLNPEHQQTSPTSTSFMPSLHGSRRSRPSTSASLGSGNLDTAQNWQALPSSNISTLSPTSPTSPSHYGARYPNPQPQQHLHSPPPSPIPPSSASSGSGFGLPHHQRNPSLPYPAPSLSSHISHSSTTTTTATPIIADTSSDSYRKLSEDLDIAKAFASHGEFKESLSRIEQVVRGRRVLLGEDHPDTLEARRVHMVTLYGAGKKNEACALGVQLREIHSRVLGSSDEATLKVMGELMKMYQDLRKWKEAQEVGRELLRSQTALKGADDPVCLACMLELASVYRELHDLNGAEQTQRHVFERRKEKFGLDDLGTVEARYALACTLSEQPSRLEEVVKMKVYVMEKRTKILGSDHGDTVKAMASLAVTYQKLNRLKDAADLEEKVVEILKNTRGEKHPDTLKAIQALSKTYSQQGKITTATAMKLGNVTKKASLFGGKSKK